MKLSKDELIKSITDKLSDNENCVSILEDISDSFCDDVTPLENRISELETENQRIETEWRNKYISRFNDNSATVAQPPVQQVATEESEIVEVPTIDEIVSKFI